MEQAANRETLNRLLEHLELKVVKEYETITVVNSFGVEHEETRAISSRIDPKTDNEKRIERLKKEITVLEELDEEFEK